MRDISLFAGSKKETSGRKQNPKTPAGFVPGKNCTGNFGDPSRMFLNRMLWLGACVRPLCTKNEISSPTKAPLFSLSQGVKDQTTIGTQLDLPMAGVKWRIPELLLLATGSTCTWVWVFARLPPLQLFVVSSALLNESYPDRAQDISTGEQDLLTRAVELRCLVFHGSYREYKQANRVKKARRKRRESAFNLAPHSRSPAWCVTSAMQRGCFVQQCFLLVIIWSASWVICLCAD